MENQTAMNLLAPLLLFASLPGVNEGTEQFNTTSNVTVPSLNVTNSTVRFDTVFKRVSSIKGGLNCTFTSDSTNSYSLQISQGKCSSLVPITRVLYKDV